MIIKIPEGEYCEECHFVLDTEDDDMFCVAFRADLSRYEEYGYTCFKCDQCKNKEPIEIKYEE